MADSGTQFRSQQFAEQARQDADRYEMEAAQGLGRGLGQAAETAYNVYQNALAQKRQGEQQEFENALSLRQVEMAEAQTAYDRQQQEFENQLALRRTEMGQEEMAREHAERLSRIQTESFRRQVLQEKLASLQAMDQTEMARLEVELAKERVTAARRENEFMAKQMEGTVSDREQMQTKLMEVFGRYGRMLQSQGVSVGWQDGKLVKTKATPQQQEEARQQIEREQELRYAQEQFFLNAMSGRGESYQPPDQQQGQQQAAAPEQQAPQGVYTTHASPVPVQALTNFKDLLKTVAMGRGRYSPPDVQEMGQNAQILIDRGFFDDPHVQSILINWMGEQDESMEDIQNNMGRFLQRTIEDPNFMAVAALAYYRDAPEDVRAAQAKSLLDLMGVNSIMVDRILKDRR